MTVQTAPALSNRRFWLLWLPTFLGFPLGGLLASLLIGPVQTPLTALMGGAIAGTYFGLAQWLALRRLYGMTWVWSLASSLGMAVGLGLGVALVGTGTGTLDLLTRGLITGFGVGAAQAYLLRKLVPACLWTLTVGVLWALAWPFTKLVIAGSIENNYTVFGASGALFFTVLSGLMLRRTAQTASQRRAAPPAPEVR